MILKFSVLGLFSEEVEKLDGDSGGMSSLTLVSLPVSCGARPTESVPFSCVT